MTTHTVESLMALADEYARVTDYYSDEPSKPAREALESALREALAQPAAECKAGGTCRWRGNASAQFLAAHDALPQEPLTDEQIDMMWRRAGIANNARGAFFAGVAAGIRALESTP